MTLAGSAGCTCDFGLGFGDACRGLGDCGDRLKVSGDERGTILLGQGWIQSQQDQQEQQLRGKGKTDRNRPPARRRPPPIRMVYGDPAHSGGPSRRILYGKLIPQEAEKIQIPPSIGS